MGTKQISSETHLAFSNDVTKINHLNIFFRFYDVFLVVVVYDNLYYIHIFKKNQHNKTHCKSSWNLTKNKSLFPSTYIYLHNIAFPYFHI